jgi:hypothetical protein
MRLNLAAPLAAVTLACLLASPGVASAAALDQDGMWVWYVGKSSGGAPARMAAQARAHNVGTVLIKAADGRSYWSQFSGPLIAALRQQGLSVCAWQYVYGRHPRAEADRGAQAARAGADCLVIDAEGEYEGRYTSAQTYLRRLRSLVGSRYELGLAGFPYVNYHPAFPYSVFLGPGGAQENLPQMYWKAIGVSTDRVYQVAYSYNAVYRRAIYPLGQTYGNPSAGAVVRFRQLARVYGARAVSWWVWQQSGTAQWNAVGSPFDPIAQPSRQDVPPLLRRGYRSDLVVWAQQHLLKLKLLRVVNGRFGPATQHAVKIFQARAGLPITGEVDALTWAQLLPGGPAVVRWSARRHRAAAADAGHIMPTPLNARIPAIRNELHRKLRH